MTGKKIIKIYQNQIYFKVIIDFRDRKDNESVRYEEIY